MKNSSLSPVLLALLIMLGFNSCDLAGDIFEAGAWTAVIGLVVVVAIVVWLVRKVM